MKYSIVVPVYNVGKFLSKCIESILNQSYTDYELILVDDGSTDNSLSICNAYAQQYDRVKVLHQANSGVVKARQTGVENAEGEYLVFVDGDDSINSNCLAIIDKVSYVDIVRFGYVRETVKGFENCTMPDRVGYYSKEDIEREIFPKLIQSPDADYFSPSVWGGAFRKEIFESNMLKDTALSIGEDGACVIPCVFHANSMYVIDECLYNYRLNLSSATKSRKVFKWNGPEIIAHHLEAKIDLTNFDMQEQLYRKIVHELFSVVVSQFNKSERYRRITRDIRFNLQNPLYDESIKKAKFKHSKKAQFMHFALKKKLFFIIKIYNKIKF